MTSSCGTESQHDVRECRRMQSCPTCTGLHRRVYRREHIGAGRGPTFPLQARADLAGRCVDGLRHL